MIAAALVIAVTRLGGLLAQTMRLPPVVGELLGGVLLGPVCLQALAPDFFSAIFDEATRSTIHHLSELAVAIFMVGIGYQARNDGHDVRWGSDVRIAAGTVIVPVACGALLAMATPRTWLPPGSNPVAFVIIGATVVAITALPVLALILHDLGIEGSREAQVTLSAAAASDLAAWVLLGVAVALQNGTGWQGALLTIAALGAEYALARLLASRALLWLARVVDGRVTAGALVGMVLAAVAAGSMADAHLTIVSLVFGLSLPDPKRRLKPCLGQLTAGNSLLLMPFFTVELGLAFSPGPILRSPTGLAATLVLTVVAVGAKQAGAVVGGLFGATPLRFRLAVGALSGAKGITEVLLLSVAVDAGIIGDALYAMGVFMALVATACSAPLWRLVRGRAPAARDGDGAAAGAGVHGHPLHPLPSRRSMLR